MRAVVPGVVAVGELLEHRGPWPLCSRRARLPGDARLQRRSAPRSESSLVTSARATSRSRRRSCLVVTWVTFPVRLVTAGVPGLGRWTEGLVAGEQRPDPIASGSKRRRPGVEQGGALAGEAVDAPLGPGGLLAPVRGDEALLLEGTKQPVEVAEVDPALVEQLFEILREPVAVAFALGKQQQDGRLGEALDAGPDLEAARADPAAAPWPAIDAHRHRSIGVLHR